MKRYTIDCRHVRTFKDFVEATNVGLIRAAGGEWNGHLDAFNDYLSWPEEDTYELELLGAETCAAALDHNAMESSLQAAVQTGHPDNKAYLEARQREAEHGSGETLFDVIRKIITDNAHVHAIFT